MSELTPDDEAELRNCANNDVWLAQVAVAELDRLRAALAERDRQLKELRAAARTMHKNSVLENGLSRCSTTCTADASENGLVCECISCRMVRWHAALSFILAALLPDPNPAKEGTPW